MMSCKRSTLVLKRVVGVRRKPAKTRWLAQAQNHGLNQNLTHLKSIVDKIKQIPEVYNIPERGKGGAVARDMQ